MKIRKAVITAGGRDQFGLAFQTLIDRDGQPKSTLRIILEEALSGGVEDVLLVVAPGTEPAYRNAVGDLPARLHFSEQQEPRGYGHAILTAREFVGADPFLHLVSDHLYISHQEARCVQQLTQIAEAESCSVSAVESTREGMLPFYGVIGGLGVPNRQRLYAVENVLEKPTPTEAEQFCLVPGLRAAHYLCFFGMHVLMPSIMEILDAHLHASPAGASLQLSPALADLARRERYLASELAGRRYNVGIKFGLLYAQLGLALAGQHRDEVLTQMIELLASHSLATERCRAN